MDSSAKALEEAVAKAETFQTARGEFDAGVVDSVIESALHLFDETHGGFGNSPKFPHASAVDLLLERYQSSRDEKLLHVVKRTLEGMARGGVYDQLAGGFHRYSVDERWLVPHFEKMSYDNSELLKNYLHGYQVTREPLFRETAEGIIDWVGEVLIRSRARRILRQPGCRSDARRRRRLFHLDAGRSSRRACRRRNPARLRSITTWSRTARCITTRRKMFCGSRATFAELAEQLGIDEASARLLIARAKGKLLAARLKRHPTPAIDTTIYVGWNAMFVSAYLEAARVLGRDDCRAFALKTLERILAEAWDEAKGFRHRVGGPQLEGSLDDQIFAAGALLDAYEATLDRRYFEIAERAVRLAVERYGDPDGGGFFDRAKDAAPMGGLDVRRKPLQDSPTPGANSVAVIVLDRLLRVHRRKTLSRLGGEDAGSFRRPGSAVWIVRRDVWPRCAVARAPSVASCGVRRGRRRESCRRWKKPRTKSYRFGKAVLRVTPENLANASLAPALRETLPHLDAAKPQALVCIETTCHPPVTDPRNSKRCSAEPRLPSPRPDPNVIACVPA